METPGSLVIIGPLEPGPIELAEYDPLWPARYEIERARIVTALGEKLIEIEHVGSTSVPGLAAKPVIDIVVEADGIGLESIDGAMREAGYDLRVVEQDHRMFRTPARDVHVHFWILASQ